jgi:maltooligosyltrehalose trehalohydrolase
MPFGAEILADGQVRFRLWAPKAQQVEVCCASDRNDVLPMHEDDSGWFELVTDRAHPGSGYKFRIDGKVQVPDPASRFQPRDVHGDSEVIDPATFDWKDESWHGRPWNEAVIYELHVGTFTSEGTYAAAANKLDYLSDLGVTAIELMPVSDFPGRRNWGYDGVLPFAPDSSYGRPEDLKRLVQAAHAMGLMIFLDVVYNHFGPEGNYLRAYAPQFFTDRHHTPWGDAINFDGPGSRAVRDFFINNALYWLTEFHFDGLRFDAVHAILDDSHPDILTEIAQAVRTTIGDERHVHLVLENDHNAARYLWRDEQNRPSLYDAQWNDDVHHAMHVIVTGETDGYYSDYADCPAQHLARCLTDGFDFQGQPSTYRDGEPRGQSSRGLPPSAFVSFLQNHDQIGNRAFGERIVKLADPSAVRAAMAVLLLAPEPPLLFMGEEMGAETPFLFFCDFGPDLAKAVTQGRRNEFSRFARFRDPSVRERIPDPNAESTFSASKMDWKSVSQSAHQHWLEFYRTLLRIRHKKIVPMLSSIAPERATAHVVTDRALQAEWPTASGGMLALVANLGPQPISGIAQPEGELIYSTQTSSPQNGVMPALSVAWFHKP